MYPVRLLVKLYLYTINSLYNDIRYNYKTSYKDNLDETNP